MQEPTGLRFKHLLLTGAAGALGRMLRPGMKRCCETLRVSDLSAMDPAGEGEEVVVAPLTVPWIAAIWGWPKACIGSDREPEPPAEGAKVAWFKLLGYRQTWAVTKALVPKHAEIAL